MKALLVVAALALGPAQGALAAGCALAGGESAVEIQAMNQLILDGRFTDFAADLEARANMNVSGAMQSVAKAYAAGFESCATILQRRDVGGMTQELVMFRSPVGPLFLYWLYVGTGEAFTVLQFKLNSDLSLLENLR